MLSRMSTVVVVVCAVLALAGGAAPLPTSSSLVAATAPLSSLSAVRWPNDVAGGLIPVRTRLSVAGHVSAAPGRRFRRATCQAALPSLHTAANWLGYAGLAAGMVASFPQYYENWKQKRGDALSMDMILLQNAASLMNASGSWLCPMPMFSRLMNLYFCLDAVMLASQSLYYNRGKTVDPASKLSKLAIVTAAIVTLTPLVVLGAGPQFGIGQAHIVAGTMSLWMSNLLFVSARLPQLWMAMRKKNVGGVSIWMYVLLIATNLMAGTGLLAKNIADRVPLSVMLYGASAAAFSGTFGPVVLDAIYLCLFWIYRPRDAVPMGLPDSKID